MRHIIYTIASLILAVNALAQTPVSGGIFSNTSWTLANSPYIITDTVVFFPNVSLTIEAGVVVRFEDNTHIEMRNSNLIASGSPVDSIYFLSNSANPTMGIYSGFKFSGNVNIDMQYCSFKLANRAIHFLGESNCQFNIYNCLFDSNIYGFASNGNNDAYGNISDCHFHMNDIAIGRLGAPHNPIFANIRNSIFHANRIGIYGYGNNPNVYNCTLFDQSESAIDVVKSVDRCIIYNNPVGIYSPFESVTNSIIVNNGIGVDLNDFISFEFSCNNVCGNSIYNVRVNTPLNTDFSNNCWCSSDSVEINQGIFNGYDDISLGVSLINPVLICDTFELNSNCQGFSIIEPRESVSLSVYPNPSSGVFSIEIPESEIINLKIIVFNQLGNQLFEKIYNAKQPYVFDISHFPNGIYLITAHDMNDGLKYRGLVFKHE